MLNKPIYYQFGDEKYKVGKLTIGAALKLESWLAKLPTPWEVLESTDILKHCSDEQKKQIIDEKLQQLHFWPPDAITALSEIKFLKRGDFGGQLIAAILESYNPHLSPDDVEKIVSKATVHDVIQIQLIATATGDESKKDLGPEEIAMMIPATERE
jgi:hypothetical protein